MLAQEEVRRTAAPADTVSFLDEQKRYLASLGTMRVDERFFAMRSDLSRRHYEPTNEECELRDIAWHRRRAGHTLQRDARLAQIRVREADANTHCPPRPQPAIARPLLRTPC